MSGHLRDDDAGDVLNSIKRLVTDGRGPTDAAPAPAQPPAGRLVLTPALRVDTPAPANTSTPSAPPADTDGTAKSPAGTDAAEPAPEPWQPNSLTLRAPEGAASISPHVSDSLSLERTIAELEAAVAASFDDWEADDPGAVKAFRASDRGAGDDVAARAENSAETPQNVEALHASPPDDEPHDAEAVGAPASADALEDCADPGTEAQAEQLADLADEEDLLVDEAALRELIAQIVREELRGTLGERITRNVRKLVRSEVARALADREFAATRDQD